MAVLLPLDSIPDDHATQARDATDGGIVEEYSAAMKDGATFPPVVLFRDIDATLRIGDGFHRIAAARLAGLESIEADIREGSARDALDCSIQANARHGLRFNNRDKRRAVGLLLDDAEWSALSDREISRRCGVSQPFVGKLRAERSDNGYHPGDDPADATEAIEAESSDNGYQSVDALTADEERQLAELETTIRTSIEGVRETVDSLAHMKQLCGREQYQAWLDEEYPGKWLDLFDRFAIFLTSEADRKRLLDAYPAPIVGDLPVGSLDEACDYSATGRRETIAKVSPSTFPGCWFVSVYHVGDDRREVEGLTRPIRDGVLPNGLHTLAYVLHTLGFVSDGTPWTSEPAESVSN
jgi:hypothetical protein